MTYVDGPAAAADRRRLLLERIAALESGDAAAAAAAKTEFEEKHVAGRDPEFQQQLAHAREHAPIRTPDEH